MAYHTYTTEAYVLHAYQLGESDALYGCFTRDFGLIRARATSVRAEVSKLRYSLQVGSRVSLSLVKGKAGWRITGAVLQSPPATGNISIFGRLARLTERLVQGEEKNEVIFEIFSTLDFLNEQRQSAELFSVIRLLVALGYVPPATIEVITSLPDSERHAYIESHRPVLLRTVNAALSSSHL